MAALKEITTSVEINSMSSEALVERVKAQGLSSDLLDAIQREGDVLERFKAQMIKLLTKKPNKIALQHIAANGDNPKPSTAQPDFIPLSTEVPASPATPRISGSVIFAAVGDPIDQSVTKKFTAKRHLNNTWHAPNATRYKVFPTGIVSNPVKDVVSGKHYIHVLLDSLEVRQEYIRHLQAFLRSKCLIANVDEGYFGIYGNSATAGHKAQEMFSNICTKKRKFCPGYGSFELSLVLYDTGGKIVEYYPDDDPRYDTFNEDRLFNW